MSPKEPFVRITRRESPMARALIIRIAAFILALIVSALIIVAIIKVNPVKVYGSMLDGAFGTGHVTDHAQIT